jgi:hypothetical protein
MTVPTGFSVSGSPITSAGTLAVTFASGYALPTTVKQSNWDDAYTFVSNFPSQTGNNGKFLYTSGSVLSWQTALQNPMTALGDMLFGGVSGAVTVLPGNQFTTRAYLQQVGTGSGSAAPTWGGIVSTDISGQAITRVNDTNVQITLTGTPGNSVLNAVGLTMGWTGQLAVGRGGTGADTLTGVVIGNATGNMTAVAGTAGQYLRRNTANTAYEFRTLQGGDIAGSELTFSNDTNVTMGLSGTPASALLQPVSINLGWAGQLSVSRGGTGASTLTGILVGNGTSAVSAITGAALQLLRRNSTNTAFEFWTANYMVNPLNLEGQIIYAQTGGTPTALNPNTTSTNKYLRSVNSGFPSWEAVSGADITGEALNTANDTNVLLTPSTNFATALLRTTTLTVSWNGQLAVSRGGSGASTLTGVLIGNGASAFTSVSGTSNQLLRRNSSNTAYEFFTSNYLVNPMTLEGSIIYAGAGGTPEQLFANSTSTRKYLSQINGTAPTWEAITGFLTGSGSINFVPIWTSSSALGNSPLSITGSEANFGSNKLVAGNTSAPNGSIMLQDNYSTGHLGNIGTMFSGGNLMLGYCVTPSTSSSTAFLSSTGLTGFARSSIVLGTDVVWYMGEAQTVAVGSSVTMSERLRLTNAGTLQITTGNLQLNTTTFISWGGAYGANIPSIQGTSGSSPGFGFYAAGSTSGLTVAFNGNGSLKFYNYQSPTSFTGTATAGLAVTSTGDLITTALSKVATEGNYTPTWTAITNVDSVTAFECRWMRIGDTLTISGKVAINATVDNTATSASFTLPTSASNPQAGYMNGVGVQEGGGASGSILGYGFNTGIFELLPLVDTTVNYSFIFTYRIV